ncbi:MAG: NUDIX domain-containing protein [Rhodospirillaceae bacterium]
MAAGLLMFRRTARGPEVLIVHPGGPFFKNKDLGVWSIPKGEADQGEVGGRLLDVARREFEEETGIAPKGGFVHLGAVRQGRRKIVEVWAFEGDCDPAAITSNTIFIAWPPGTGRKLKIPEVDRAQFATLPEARKKLLAYQAPILDALERYLAGP